MKLEKIVVGYVDSAEGRDALALARWLAASFGAELLVASVLEYAPAPIDTRGYDRALEERFEQLFATAGEALGEGVEFAPHRLTHPSPAEALTELAERESADAIVVGSTHRGPIGRILPGTVAERLLSGGPCAVAVSPRGYADREPADPGVVGVAFDGRRESWVALRFAAALAGSDRLLRLITVVPPVQLSSPIQAGIEEAQAARREEYAQLLDRALVSLEPDVRVESRLLDGDPGEILASQSSEVDLVVVGSRGYGPLRRVFTGGVSAFLVRGSHAPLVALPRGAAEDTG